MALDVCGGDFKFEVVAPTRLSNRECSNSETRFKNGTVLRTHVINADGDGITVITAKTAPTTATSASTNDDGDDSIGDDGDDALPGPQPSATSRQGRRPHFAANI